MGKSKAKKPTLDQKKIMSEHKLVWKNWLVISDTEEELRLVSKASGITRVIQKKKATAGQPSQTVAKQKRRFHYSRKGEKLQDGSR